MRCAERCTSRPQPKGCCACVIIEAGLFLLDLICVFVSAPAPQAHALGEPQVVSFSPAAGAFAVVAQGRAAPIVVSAKDWAGVQRAAGDLGQDVQRVTGVLPNQEQIAGGSGEVIIVGTIGKSPLIDDLVQPGQTASCKYPGQVGSRRDHGPGASVSACA